MIDVNSGCLLTYWELDFLNINQDSNVLNGIAFLKDRDSFLLTGKNFQNIFEVKVDYKKFV